MKKFKWAILGSGMAARKFVLGLRASSTSVATAVASRSYENAKRFGESLGIATIHGSYADAIQDGAVDGFYIATPPTTHRDYALRCLETGKAVLIEKPFTTNAEEAGDIVALARQRNVFCMEAMWTRFMPLLRQVKTLVDSGELGEIRMISGSFGLAEIPDPANPLFNPALGGGALLDRAVYPISLTQHLLGSPRAVTADAIVGSTGVDEQTAAILRYDSGALAVLYASLTTQAPNELTIMGSDAVLQLLPPVFRPFRMRLTRIHPRPYQPSPWSHLAPLRESHWIHQAMQRVGSLVIPWVQRGTRTITVPYTGNGYHHEADEVVRCVSAGRLESAVMPLDDSIAVMKTLDSIRTQCLQGHSDPTAE